MQDKLSRVIHYSPYHYLQLYMYEFLYFQYVFFLIKRVLLFSKFTSRAPAYSHPKSVTKLMKSNALKHIFVIDMTIMEFNPCL